MKTPNWSHSRSDRRSGWGVSPRRESLAQASPLRLGESSRIWNRGLRTFSLRRDLPRLGETFTCSKLSESPRRPLAREGLGKPLLASPGRDMLAWASLTARKRRILHKPTTHHPFQAISTTYTFKNHKVHHKTVHKTQ